MYRKCPLTTSQVMPQGASSCDCCLYFRADWSLSFDQDIECPLQAIASYYLRHSANKLIQGLDLVPPFRARNRTEVFIVQHQCSSTLTFGVNTVSNICIDIYVISTSRECIIMPSFSFLDPRMQATNPYQFCINSAGE